MNRFARIALAAFAVAFALPLAAAEPSKSRSCADMLKGTSPMKVKLTTSMGPITIELDKAKAPASVENFVKYVESGHYNGTIFHRVIDGFMIQGGGFDKDMRQKATNPPIKNEADNGLKNDKYTVAMARTQVPDSATAQFFINTKDNAFLNHTAKNVQGWGYAVFGKVVDGQPIVDKIGKVATGNAKGMGDVPLEPVTIEKAECVA